MTDTAPAKPKRRFLRFSLRTLLLGMVALGSKAARVTTGAGILNPTPRRGVVIQKPPALAVGGAPAVDSDGS